MKSLFLCLLMYLCFIPMANADMFPAGSWESSPSGELTADIEITNPELGDDNGMLTIWNTERPLFQASLNIEEICSTNNGDIVMTGLLKWQETTHWDACLTYNPRTKRVALRQFINPDTFDGPLEFCWFAEVEMHPLK